MLNTEGPAKVEFLTDDIYNITCTIRLNFEQKLFNDSDKNVSDSFYI